MAPESAGTAPDLTPAGVDAVIDRIFSPSAVRAGARAIFDLAAAGGTHFKLHLERLDEVADYTIAVTRANYPDLNVPYHARHGHLRAGGVDRPGQLAARSSAASVGEGRLQRETVEGFPLFVSGEARAERERRDKALRSTIDLVVVSVLLDAGAGDRWTYREEATARTWARSEGLAIASFDMFMAGAFSGDPSAPLRADIPGLLALTSGALARGFQVSAGNPLVGIDGRVALLNNLAGCMARQPRVFPHGRVADLLDHLPGGSALRAAHILDFVLRRFGDIWPARTTLGGRNLGDVWSYRPLGPGAAGLVPFHKLSQWLTYSLIVPLVENGHAVEGIDELTGLAEYRNGGLMLDGGVLELRDPALAVHEHAPQSELVVEWRALTVALLDLIAERVRRRLGLNPAQLPLASVLEGGTWHAGRRIAAERRPGGEPPLRIVSDGTVF